MLHQNNYSKKTTDKHMEANGKLSCTVSDQLFSGKRFGHGQPVEVWREKYLGIAQWCQIPEYLKLG